MPINCFWREFQISIIPSNFIKLRQCWHLILPLKLMKLSLKLMKFYNIKYLYVFFVTQISLKINYPILDTQNFVFPYVLCPSCIMLMLFSPWILKWGCTGNLWLKANLLKQEKWEDSIICFWPKKISRFGEILGYYFFIHFFTESGHWANSV